MLLIPIPVSNETNEKELFLPIIGELSQFITRPICFPNNEYWYNIYDYLPKQVTIPYLRLRIVNYVNLHMLSNFATKVRFSCDINTYHISSMLAAIKHVSLVVKSISSETILESNCAINQHDEVLHSTINFDILIQGGSDEQITAEN